MPRFIDIQRLLDNAIAGGQIGAHQEFWRELSRDQFVAKKVYGYPVVVVGDATASNIVKAVRGQLPFGEDTGEIGASMPRMPAFMAAMSEKDIQLIEQWINEGCPA